VGRQFGATHVINSREADPVEGIRALTGGNGADVVIEGDRPPGRPTSRRSTPGTWPGPWCWSACPPRACVSSCQLLDIFGRGGALKSSWYGDCLPERDFPVLIDLYLQGRLPLDKFVSEIIALDAVEEGPSRRWSAVSPAQRGDALMTAQVAKIVTSGTFSLDGQDFAVDNNRVADRRRPGGPRHRRRARPGRDPGRGRRPPAVRHRLHPRPQRPHRRGTAGREAAGAPELMHPDDQVLWRMIYPGHAARRGPGGRAGHRGRGTPLRVLHTPGHSPGSVCLYAPALRVVFSGDTCSAAARARPAARTRTTTRSSGPSGTGCWTCRRRPSCTPGTARTPRSARIRPVRPLSHGGSAHPDRHVVRAAHGVHRR